MKLLLGLLLLAGGTYAQTPAKAIRLDSIPAGKIAPILPPDLMPNVRPDNSFYRDHRDPENVVRATLDNMPVKVPDSSTNYTMLRSFGQPIKPNEPPTQRFKFMPPVVPKKP